MRFPPALRHRRYRLLWIGLMISVTGTRMQSAAVLWHVHEINGQPIALGGVGLANILPILLLSLVAGVAADSVNRRQLMFLTQTSLALLAALLGWLTITGSASLWTIYAISALSSGVATFDMPARQALVPNLVAREDLTNAFSLNSIAYQVGSVAGPALGGLVIARAGIAYAYWVNAISYAAVLVALLLMGRVVQQGELDPAAMEQARRQPFSAFLKAASEGVHFVVGHAIIFPNMLLDFLATFFSSATALLPIFARDILAVGAVGYGWLVAAPSIGAGAVAAILAFSGPIRRQGKVLLAAVAGFGLATVVFGLSRAFWLTFVSLVLVGGSDGVSTIVRNTIRQLLTPDRLRGRMTSVNQMFFMGGPQLGELEAGLVAQAFGAPISVVSGGIGCLLTLGWVSGRYPELRHYDISDPAHAVDELRAPGEVREA
ncbi:MAG: MFS transporter [Anaerolineales bacterium]|nr:MFS transporter [Anaerolineales bacterium]